MFRYKMLIVSEKATRLEKNIQYLFNVIACVKRIRDFFLEYCALFRKHQLEIYLHKVMHISQVQQNLK